MKQTWLGYLLAIVTVTIWSSTFIITKLVLDYISPIQLLTVRIFLTVIFLWVIMPKKSKVFIWKVELLYLFSGLGLALYFIFENTSVLLTMPSNVGLLVALSPIFTTVLVSIKEKTSYFIPKNIIGLLLALVGVFFVEFGNSAIHVAFLGDMLAILAALMFSFYTFFLSKIKDDTHLIIKTRKVFTYVFLVLFLYQIVMKESFVWDSYNATTIGGVIFLALVASSLAFLFWNHSITLIGTFKTNIFIYLIPVITMVMSYLVMDDPITLFKVIGTVVIIVGLYLSEKN